MVRGGVFSVPAAKQARGIRAAMVGRALMKQVSLDLADWTVRAVGDLSAVPSPLRGREVPARVPGCVHTDLIRAGLIPDPLVGMNERQVKWIGETDWEYRCRFEAGAGLLAHERVELVCEGLDTIAEVRLSGVEVGRAANMFHPHRFDVREAVRAGENELSITFRSPLKHIRAEEQRLGKRPVNGDWDPYIYIRKAACNFGWDWAPMLATCGIWKPIAMEGWSRLRVVTVVPVTRRIEDGWRADVTVNLEWASADSAADGLELVVTIIDRDDSDGMCVTGKRPLTTRSMRETLAIEAFPHHVWWPRGLGNDTRRYDLDVQVLSRAAPLDPVAEWRGKLGFREVRLKTSLDEHGSAFTLEVNGRDVFCQGANWIPEGPWPGQVSPETYRHRLQQAASANMNMLRVWGGGYYEADAFYEICDELGILVWQDFMFACAMYPEEEPYPALIEAEARHQVARLSSHPSVVLWCGGNECTWAHDAWGNAPGERPWKERLGDKSWGAHYYHDLLPRIVGELSPGTPYWPNSPYPGAPTLPPNSSDHGDRHTWDLRGDGYRSIVPRFCSEFGQQSPSNVETLSSVLSPADFWVGSPGLEHRQRATGGTPRHIDEPVAALFRPPTDFLEWHRTAQLAQAVSLRTGIEWLRVNRARCMGALIWQLNECWPGMSWSIIDAGGREKPAYEAVRRAFSDVLLTIQPSDGAPWLYLVNDRESEEHVEVGVRRVRLDGTIIASKTVRAVCSASGVARVADLNHLLGPPPEPSSEYILAEGEGLRAIWLHVPPREMSNSPPLL